MPPLPDDFPFPDGMTLDPESMRRARAWRASPSGLRWQAEHLQRELAELHAALGVASLPPAAPAPAEDIAEQVAARLLPKLTGTAPRTAAGPNLATTTPVPSPMPELVRARDVGMTSREWRAAIHRGELRARKVGREYAATRADFDAYLAARQVAPGPKRPSAERRDPVRSVVDRALAAGTLRVVSSGKGVR